MRICTDKAINNKNFAVLHICTHFNIDCICFLTADRHIHLAPVNKIMHGRFINDETIIGGTTRVFSGVDNKCTGAAKLAFASFECMFNKFSRCEVAINSLGVKNAHLFKICFHIHAPFSINRFIERFYFLMKRIPSVLGPQWLATVQPAVVRMTSSKSAISRTSFTHS